MGRWWGRWWRIWWGFGRGFGGGFGVAVAWLLAGILVGILVGRWLGFGGAFVEDLVVFWCGLRRCFWQSVAVCIILTKYDIFSGSQPTQPTSTLVTGRPVPGQQMPAASRPASSTSRRHDRWGRHER